MKNKTCCIDCCEREDAFIEEHLTNEGYGKYICCCICPALEKCKELDDGFGCSKAKNGMFNSDNYVECDSCVG